MLGEIQETSDVNEGEEKKGVINGINPFHNPFFPQGPLPDIVKLFKEEYVQEDEFKKLEEHIKSLYGSNPFVVCT